MECRSSTSRNSILTTSGNGLSRSISGSDSSSYRWLVSEDLKPSARPSARKNVLTGMPECYPALKRCCKHCSAPSGIQYPEQREEDVECVEVEVQRAGNIFISRIATNDVGRVV